jgi:hypothetical protein
VQARNESGRRTVTAGARVVSILRRLDLKAGIEQPLNDDICRVCRVKEDLWRKIAAAEQVDEHVLGSELAHCS